MSVRRVHSRAVGRGLGALGLSAAVAVGAWAANEPPVALPVAQPISRYQKIIDDSPFRKPTEAAPVATPPPKQPSFAEDLFVSGVMTVSGKNYVTLVQRSDSQRFSIASGEDNPHGLTVVNIQFSETYTQTRVTVKKGNEFGVLMFDQNAAARPAAPVRLPSTPPVPGVAGGAPGGGFSPPPGSRPVIPTIPPGARVAPTPPPAQPVGVQGIPGLPATAPAATGGENYNRPRPRPIIKADPNAPPAAPPIQRSLPNRPETVD